MPEGERKSHTPRWAEQERLGDMAWIAENMDVFWTAAQAGYAEWGRGAVTVDTTARPARGGGNPLWYVTQEQVGEYFGPDEIRMVAVYEPPWQFVAILLKQEGRVSAYRIGVPAQRPQSGEGW
jgi:hypothetical protein